MEQKSPNTQRSEQEALLTRQRAAFLAEGPPLLAARLSDLDKLKQAIITHRGEFKKSIYKDYQGRSFQETELFEIVSLVQGINYLRRHLRRWMRPEKRRVALHFRPGRARVTYQPLGVIGIISPWNFPLALSLMPLATAIAAGNRAMIKPSEHTPETSRLLKEVISKTFPETQVAIITGGVETGTAFAGLAFDHLIFTGNTQIGKAVMQTASQNLTPLTLELGGKSPVILEKGYSIERAAKSIAFGKLANAGQVCIAPDYVLLPESEMEPFIKSYDRAVSALYPSGVADKNYTSIINERHYQRLESLLEDAKAKGAIIKKVGVQESSASELAVKQAGKMAPALVMNVAENMAIAQEEIFGPLLLLIQYHTIEDAIAYVNKGPHPLALYYFGRKSEARRKILTKTISGNVTLNDTLLHYAQDDLPFGGVGESGMGAYHGHEGFKALSHAKGIFEQSQWNFTHITRPPFSKLTSRVIKFLLR